MSTNKPTRKKTLPVSPHMRAVPSAPSTPKQGDKLSIADASEALIPSMSLLPETSDTQSHSPVRKDAVPSSRADRKPKRTPPPPPRTKPPAAMSINVTTNSQSLAIKNDTSSVLNSTLTPPSSKRRNSAKSQSKTQKSPRTSTKDKTALKRAKTPKHKKRRKRRMKEREIRSKLNNDANSEALDSMLEILRRATLVKSAQRLYMAQVAAEKEQHQQRQQQQQNAMQKIDLNACSAAFYAAVSAVEEVADDCATVDLDAYRNRANGSENEKERAKRFHTKMVTGTDIVLNQNPLIQTTANTAEENGDELQLQSNAAGNNEGAETSENMQTQNGGEADDNEQQQQEEEEEDDGYQTPPELFRDDADWDWTENDIVFDAKNLNFGISLQLLHLSLTNGPLFPNSIMKWTKLKFREHAPTPRTGHVSAFMDDKMVIFGGYCKQVLTDHIFLVDLKEFDPKKPLEVSPISSLEKINKTYRVGHCGVTLPNNCLYLFGGWNDQQYINHGLVLNVDSLKLVNEGTKDRELPPPRRDAQICKMGPYLLLFGGWSHDYDGNELWLLGANWKWQRLEVAGKPPSNRRGHTCTVIGSHMYVFGGLYGFTRYLNDLHMYDGDSNEWVQPDLVGATRPPPRAWHSATAVGASQILFFGGTRGRNHFFNDCWVFDTCGFFWFQIEVHGTSPLPRCSHSMVKMYEDEQFCKEAYTNECIRVTKQGTLEDAAFRRDRLKLLMFGGLVAVDADAAGAAAVEGDEKPDLELSKELSVSVSMSASAHTGEEAFEYTPYDDDDDDDDSVSWHSVEVDLEKRRSSTQRASKKKLPRESSLLDVVKADISEQHKLEKRKSSQMQLLSDDDFKVIQEDIEQTTTSDQGYSGEGEGEEDEEEEDEEQVGETRGDGKKKKKTLTMKADANEIDSCSDSEPEEHTAVNKVELSGDLYMLMLEI